MPLATLTLPCSTCHGNALIEIHARDNWSFAEMQDAGCECAAPAVDDQQVWDEVNDSYELRRDLRTQDLDDYADARYRASVGD